MFKFSLCFPWREENDRSGRVDIAIEGLNPREHYGDMRGEGERQAWERHARICAHCARSTVAFMDATGLEICYDFSAVFGEAWQRLPDGADHTRIWRKPVSNNGGAPAFKYLVTTEPYQEAYKKVEASCARQQHWECTTLPPGFGLHLPTGEMGTRLVLISPPEIGLPVAPLVPLLCERMPQWTDADEKPSVESA